MAVNAASSLRRFSRRFSAPPNSRLLQHYPPKAKVGYQQAALIGQACFAPGMMKSAHGTRGWSLVRIRPGSQQKQQLSVVLWPTPIPKIEFGLL
jgi:glycerol kinase